MYNQRNWRDILSEKPKDMTRDEYEITLSKTDEDYMTTYRINRAKKNLRKFNDLYRNGETEMYDERHIQDPATQMHHIFPASDYPVIADYLENLIALTSGQHLQKAHPNGNTSAIDKDYQYTCLIAKTDSIRKNLIDNHGEPVIYDFNDFMYVLDVGLETDYFGALPQCDFGAVLTGIEFNF